MVQKEFYEKLVAKGKERKAISVLANHSLDIKKIMNVSKSNFLPPPKVDSVVLELTAKKIAPKELISAVNKLFSYRKKSISNILKLFGVKIESDKRLHEVSNDKIIQRAKKII